MGDPTKEEIYKALHLPPDGRTDGDLNLDVERAIYWFANDWHGGQSSNLYSILSTGPYKPGRPELGCSDEDESGECYDTLVEAFRH